jgi:hypothetical protein
MKKILFCFAVITLLALMVSVEVQARMFHWGWWKNGTAAKVETLLVIQNTTNDTTEVMEIPAAQNLFLQARCGQAQDNDSIAIRILILGNQVSSSATSPYWVAIDSINTASTGIVDSTAVWKQVTTTKMPVRYVKAVLVGLASNKKVTGTRVYIKYCWQE